MNMRAGCLLLLGALARHHSGARDLADHLLSLEIPTNWKPEKGQNVLAMSPISHETGKTNHWTGVHVLASTPFPNATVVTPPLTLFMMEVCALNAEPLASAEHGPGHPCWALLTLLS